jgi:hypothetical protein
VPAGPAVSDKLAEGDKGWFAGAAVATSTALLTFGKRGDPTLRQQQAVVWLGRQVGRWQVRGIAGGQFGATLSGGAAAGTLDAGAAEFSPGWVLGASAARRWLPQEGARPFVDGSLALAVSSVTSADSRLTAADLRVGVDVGWMWADRWQFTGVARAFGGPVLWQRNGVLDSGTDRRHFQLGVGGAVRLGATSVFAQVVPLGEVGASAGVVTRW